MPSSGIEVAECTWRSPDAEGRAVVPGQGALAELIADSELVIGEPVSAKGMPA
jgi:hypothetical protein